MNHSRFIKAYDAEWSCQEFTEQHALFQVDKLLPDVPGAVYLAFPWTMLIDQLNSKELSADKLREAVNAVKPSLNEHKYVVTVCQHVDMLNHQELFIENGITHVFWAHAVKGQHCFSDHEQIKIMPFPLLPFKVNDFAPSCHVARRYLYSLIFPRSEERISGNSLELILAELSDKHEATAIPFISRDYNEGLSGTVIYDKLDIERKKVIGAPPIERAGILHESIFSLCFSSAGLSVSRLWESIACESIPVVLSDSYLPPGSSALWELATVSCSGRVEDIMALPDRLAALARDVDLLEQKRHSLRQLWMIYGPDCFIYDIYKLFLSFAGETVETAMAQSTLCYGSLYSMAAEINRANNVDRSVADVFILGCSSRVLSDPLEFLARFKEKSDFRTAYQLALGSCSLIHAESMRKALQMKKIVFEFTPDR